MAASTTKFAVYQDSERWVPVFNWYWLRPGETGVGHGPFPARWLAELAARWQTR